MKTKCLPFRAAHRLALVIAASLLFGSFATAQTAGNGSLKRADRNFIEKAAKSGSEEVAVSQVAIERTMNPQVKDFASMMVSDHTAANAALADLASTKGVALPAKEVADSKWSKKNGKDFDEDYIDQMVSDHESAVELFTKEANDGNDDATVAFARKTLPKLQHHLEQAKDLKKMLK